MAQGVVPPESFQVALAQIPEGVETDGLTSSPTNISEYEGVRTILRDCAQSESFRATRVSALNLLELDEYAAATWTMIETSFTLPVEKLSALKRFSMESSNAFFSTFYALGYRPAAHIDFVLASEGAKKDPFFSVALLERKARLEHKESFYTGSASSQISSLSEAARTWLLITPEFKEYAAQNPEKFPVSPDECRMIVQNFCSVISSLLASGETSPADIAQLLDDPYIGQLPCIGDYLRSLNDPDRNKLLPGQVKQ